MKKERLFFISKTVFGVFQEMYIQFQIFLPKKFHNFSLNKNIFLFNPALFNLHN